MNEVLIENYHHVFWEEILSKHWIHGAKATEEIFLVVKGRQSNTLFYKRV